MVFSLSKTLLLFSVAKGIIWVQGFMLQAAAPAAAPVAMVYSNGDKYDGEWKDGQRHGRGTMTDYDGSIYTGEFKDGYLHGQGTMVDEDGTKYVGEWKNDEEHGQGTMTYLNGSQFVGEFQDGIAWKGTEYDEDGEITATYSDGVMKEK